MIRARVTPVLNPMLRIGLLFLAGIANADDQTARAAAGAKPPGEADSATAAAAEPAPVSPEAAGQSAEPAIPASPTELFARLSQETRPQWRLQYRETVTRCLGDRNQAALGLGAVAADLFLAVQARDAQQVRNLLQDGEMIEKTLGLAEVTGLQRQQILAAAGQEEWEILTTRVSGLVEAWCTQLRAQKDEALADITYIGEWLRCLQICHAVTIARRISDPGLAGGNPALIGEMKRRLALWSDPATESNRTLRTLHRRLTSLEKLWRQDVPEIERTGRLHRSAGLLDETVALLIQDESVPSSQGNSQGN